MTRYSQVSQFEDIEIQRGPLSSSPPSRGGNRRDGSQIRSITVTKETLPNGSIVKRKETTFANGRVATSETPVFGGPLDLGIRYIPTSIVTTPASQILPFHQGDLCKTRAPPEESNRRLFYIFGSVLGVLLLFQLFLWFMIKSGRDLEGIFDVLRIWKPEFVHWTEEQHWDCFIALPNKPELQRLPCSLFSLSKGTEMRSHSSCPSSLLNR